MTSTTAIAYDHQRCPAVPQRCLSPPPTRRGVDQRQLLDEVGGVEHRVGAIADQQVAAARCFAVDVARDGEHRHAVLGCPVSGDQCPSPLGGFDDDHRIGKPGNDPVSRRKPSIVTPD